MCPIIFRSIAVPHSVHVPCGMNRGSASAVGDDHHRAIDFERLYREEKRRIAGERRRQLQPPQPQRATVTVGTAVAALPGEDTATATTTASTTAGVTAAVADTSSVAGAEASATTTIRSCPSFPPWTLKRLPVVSAPYAEAAAASASATRSNDRGNNIKEHCCITNTAGTGDPPAIYYQPNFLADAVDYQAELIRWLGKLPHNRHCRSNNNNSSTNGTSDEDAANGTWTRLPHAQRRVALFDGRRLAAARRLDRGDDQARAAPADCWFPEPLQQLVDRMVQAGAFAPAAAAVVGATGDDAGDTEPLRPTQLIPNHILINEYDRPARGILPHTDGPAYRACTATVSLGRGSVLLHFAPAAARGGTNGFDDDDDDDDSALPPRRAVQVLLHGHGSLVVFEREAYARCTHAIADLDRRGSDDDIDEHGHEGATEYAGDQCLNAPAGTAVVRGTHRISITVRCKK